MVTIIHKETHHVENLGNASHAQLTEASVVLIQQALSNTHRIRRVGTSIVIQHPSYAALEIQNFFSKSQPTDHSLVFIDPNAECTWLRFTNDLGEFYARPKIQKIQCYSELLYLLNTDSDSALFQHNTAEYDYDELLLNCQLPLESDLKHLRA